MTIEEIRKRISEIESEQADLRRKEVELKDRLYEVVRTDEEQFRIICREIEETNDGWWKLMYERNELTYALNELYMAKLDAKIKQILKD